MSRSPVSAHSRLATAGEVPVLAVFPAALFGDCLQHPGGGGPALLGGLADIAYGQLVEGLGQEGSAVLTVLLSLFMAFLIRKNNTSGTRTRCDVG